MEIDALVKIILLAAAPISELRGAIPYGILVAKLPVMEVFAFSLLGNFLPIIPLFFGIQSFLNWLGRFAIPGNLLSGSSQEQKIEQRL